MLSKIKKYFRTGNNINVIPQIQSAKASSSIGFGFNFIREDANRGMIEIIFPSGSGGENINIFPAGWKWEHIAVSCGFFKSLSEAKRAGWDGEIPGGYNERKNKGLWQMVYIYVPPKKIEQA